MKNCILLLILSVCLVSCKSDEKAVKECFENYKINLLNENGREVVKYLDKGTLYYYDMILSKVKHAPKSVVYNLNIMDRLLILKTRNQIPRDTINSFTTEAYIRYAIENGMFGRNIVDRLNFKEIKMIKDKEAKARIKFEGTNKLVIFKFTKEENIWNKNGVWKVNLKPIISLGYKALKIQARLQNLSEDEYVMSLLQATNDGAVKANIWRPTVRKKIKR